LEIKEKKLGAETIKEIQMQFVCSSSRSRPTKIEDNQIYNTAGIEVNLNFRVVWLNSTSMWE
jgi:hypothetical protein